LFCKAREKEGSGKEKVWYIEIERKEGSVL